MRIIVGDIETFKYDWISVFYDISRNEWLVYHNDNNGVRDLMAQTDVIFCGFNNKHYDNHIWKAICCGADPTLVKQISDFIIEDERPGWEHWFIRKNRFWFDSFDLMDDTQVGTSLKHIEAHLGWNIEETEVDFNIDRPLTRGEIQQTIYYCKWDVRATTKLLTMRKNYLDCKIDLGRMCDLSAAKALYCTNARLTAKYLGATYVERDDGREYTYPDNLRTYLIPNEILDFFMQIRDMSIPDDVLFKRKLDIVVGGCPCTYAWGGVHGSLTQYYEAATATRVIQNRDVSSLYPSLLDLYNYISRNCADPNKYRNTKNERLEAKRRGDKKTANTLKNPLNVTSGAMDQPTNDLYDPRNARSMRISGQLFLTELVIELLTECKTLKLLNFNTDGLMYSVDKSELPKVDAICAAWEKRTRFELETDEIQKVYIKDVNNLLFVDTNDHVKTVGGYLNYGVAEKGAWKINNDFTIVKDAVIANFVHGTPVEETIYQCTDISKFQIIAKAGGGYKSVHRVPPDFEDRKKQWQKNNRFRGSDNKLITPRFTWDCYAGPRAEVQRVNRVYASLNPNMGTLVKVKPDGTVGKIGGLPESCIIDNKNNLTIDQIDRSWYVDLANKYIKDYRGGA
ncbi:MAG: DNA polymerase elongation subunit (family B) [Clostridia bacterium]|nr:DNA polymerase elongation subunit (family B) [Clostridia bacterium]